MVRYILTNNTHIRKVDLTGAWTLRLLLRFFFIFVNEHVNVLIANQQNSLLSFLGCKIQDVGGKVMAEILEVYERHRKFLVLSLKLLNFQMTFLCNFSHYSTMYT